MSVTRAEAPITSEVPDIHEEPLDSGATIGAEEYAVIEHLIGLEDPGSHTVSAFNSSI